jgi:hypothetical protein
MMTYEHNPTSSGDMIEDPPPVDPREQVDTYFKKYNAKIVAGIAHGGIILSSAAYAVVKEPDYFANTVWGYGSALLYGFANDVVFSIGAFIGIKLGAAVTKRNEDSLSTIVGNLILPAVIVGGGVLAYYASDIYNKAKEWREPYRQNISTITSGAVQQSQERTLYASTTALYHQGLPAPVSQ